MSAERSRRLLVVTQTHNVWGGMEQWLHHFTAWLQDHGWSVRAALPRGRKYNDPDTYLREHPHLDAVILDVRDGSERTRVDALRRAILDTRPDVVIPIATGAVFAAMTGARRSRSGARLLIPIRSMHPDLFCNIADHIAHVDQIVCVSRLIESTITALLPAERDRIAYVRHGVRPASRPRLPRGNALRIGFVGRLEESSKRVLDLAVLAEELARRSIRAEVDVFGSGPDEAALREAVRAARLPVRFRGAMSQEVLYEQAYPNLDVLMLFSPAEGSPNAVYEAMQHGVVPAVSRYLGQSAERIVRHGETGLVFPVGDMAAAAEAIAVLAADDGRFEQLSAAAAAEMASDTPERMHRDWERILEETIARPPKPPAPGPVVARGGRLDAFLPARMAASFRRLTGRGYVHPDGWGEWPGTAPASRECVARVERLIRELD